MDKPRVSVIVPIYNSAQCLSKCLESLVHQTYSNIEIILINDGSKDCSGDICTKYATDYNGIIYIYQDNAGVSSARNAGLKVASGKYVMFCDSDDYLERDSIERLIELDAGKNVDWIVGSMLKHIGDSIQHTDISNRYATSHDEIFDAIQEMNKLYLMNQPVAKLYKKELIMKNGLRYNILLSCGEDFDFNCRYACIVKNIMTTDTLVYHYVISQEQSLSGKFQYNPFDQSEIVFASLKQLYSTFQSDAKKIQTEVNSIQANRLWNFMGAINSPNCSLRFIDKVNYIGRIRMLPSYKECILSRYPGLSGIKLQIARIPSSFVIASVIVFLRWAKR